MMRALLYFCLLVLLAVACETKQPTPPAVDIPDELSQLQDSIMQYSYLKDVISTWRGIYNKRQQLQRDRPKLDAREYEQMLQKLDQRDTIQIQRLDGYLGRFGYPNERYNAILDGRFVAINIHYLADTLPARERFLDYIYQGWQDGKVSDGDFAAYLNGNHLRKYGQYVSLEGVFTEQDRLEVLLKKLQLTARQGTASGS